MFPALRAVAKDPEGKVLLVGAVTVVSVGTVVYMVLEHWSLLDSLYFCVVTLATVGFGDLHPTTDAAKLFTIFYILTGIGILAGFASELTKFRRAAILGDVGEAGLGPDAQASKTTEAPARKPPAAESSATAGSEPADTA
jgi:voltage-gated potassium channel